MNRIPFKLIPVVLAVTFLASCGKDPNKPGLEFMPDMYRSPSYETYQPNPMFGDSLSARLPVAGTIPRGYHFFNYPGTREGYDAAGRDLVNPFPSDTLTLAQGKHLYTNFCMHCHGEAGGGDGSLIATGKFPPPPSYFAGVSSRGGNMRDLTDGKIYHTIVYGLNLMGPHASQLNPEERWKVVMYVKQLMKAGAPATADTTATPKESPVAMN
jgi:mono/diheme cytochrome c family protein